MSKADFVKMILKDQYEINELRERITTLENIVEHLKNKIRKLNEDYNDLEAISFQLIKNVNIHTTDSSMPVTVVRSVAVQVYIPDIKVATEAAANIEPIFFVHATRKEILSKQLTSSQQPTTSTYGVQVSSRSSTTLPNGVNIKKETPTRLVPPQNVNVDANLLPKTLDKANAALSSQLRILNTNFNNSVVNGPLSSNNISGVGGNAAQRPPLTLRQLARRRQQQQQQQQEEDETEESEEEEEAVAEKEEAVSKEEEAVVVVEEETEESKEEEEEAAAALSSSLPTTSGTNSNANGARTGVPIQTSDGSAVISLAHLFENQLNGTNTSFSMTSDTPNEVAFIHFPDGSETAATFIIDLTSEDEDN